jgi:hypothetical protein
MVFISVIWHSSYVYDCSFLTMGQSIYMNVYVLSPFNNDVSMQIFVSADYVTHS